VFQGPCSQRTKNIEEEEEEEEEEELEEKEDEEYEEEEERGSGSALEEYNSILLAGEKGGLNTLEKSAEKIKGSREKSADLPVNKPEAQEPGKF
jgi:hypothetical protein